MPRVKRGTVRRAKRQRLLKRAKGDAPCHRGVTVRRCDTRDIVAGLTGSTDHS